MHRFILLAVDMLLIAVATTAAIILTTYGSAVPLGDPIVYLAATLAVALPTLVTLRLNRTVWRFTSLSDGMPVMLAAIVIAVSASSIGLALDRFAGAPPSLPVVQGLLIFYALGGVRAVMRARHARRMRAQTIKSAQRKCRESVLLVGLSGAADLFLYSAAQAGHGGPDIVGILSQRDRHKGCRLRSYPILGAPEAIEDVLDDLAIHGVSVGRVVLALPLSHFSTGARDRLRQLERSGRIKIDYLSQYYGFDAGRRDSPVGAASAVVGSAASGDEVLANADLPSSAYLRWKRLLDAAVALVCIVCFAPLMLLVFIAVRMDVGAPAIFWQQRPGARGRPIRVLKFRTMGPAWDRQGRRLSDAERISTVGRLLRRLRIDELPQVYNVLAGHMSLVGPRPLLPIDQPASPSARLLLRPGLTGWAQINGGRQLSIEDKAALDIWYIKNASFGLDLFILAHTLRTVLFGERIDRRAIHAAWQDLPPKEGSPILLGDIAEQDSI